MPQMLLFPDPRPLVERLGAGFFRSAPAGPGVYLMRDEAGLVLYVGKARNLRRRLGSYRVANPDRLPRRHLRLLRAVARIDLETCPDEAAALAREAELLRSLRPRFNRAGTWPGTPRFLAWRTTAEGLDLAAPVTVAEGWRAHGPLGAGAFILRAALARLLWCAVYPERGLAGMPAGWFRHRRREEIHLPGHAEALPCLHEAAVRLDAGFAGAPEGLLGWLRDRTAAAGHPFEAAVREEDLDTVTEFVSSRAANQAAILDKPPACSP